MVYEAEKIILATGTKPASSPKVPIDGRSIINSDQVLLLPELPKTLIVVGGGVIGVEYTCMFAALGVRVILVEAAQAARVCRSGDRGSVEHHLRDSRVTMRLNEEVESVEPSPDSGVVAPFGFEVRPSATTPESGDRSTLSTSSLSRMVTRLSRRW